jgi:hypothetical protein
MLTISSNLFNWGSPNISHHLPLSSSSLGVAAFHSSLAAISLKATGVCAIAGRWYFGPMVHAEQKMKGSAAAFQ